MFRLYILFNFKIYSKPCGDMADVLMSLKHTVPTPQSSVDEQHQQHDQAYGLSTNHNVSTKYDGNVLYYIYSVCRRVI